MSPSILEFVITCLRQRHGRLPEVAQATGVPLRTLRKISTGEIKDPGIVKVETLLEYFKPGARAALVGGQ